MNKFEAKKNAKELGIDKTRKLVVFEGYEGLFSKGDILTLIKDDDTYNPKFKRMSDGYEAYFPLEWTQYFEKSLTNLEPGDVLNVKFGTKRTVLDSSKNGVVVYLSEAWNENMSPSARDEKQNKTGIFLTGYEMNKKGWSIYTPPAVPDVQEMTVEEVSKLVGKTVKIVDKK